MYVINLLKDSSILIDGNKVVDSSTVEQHVVPDASYNVFSSVTVNPYELDSKTVDSSTVSQTVTSDKDGLSSVTVNPYELDQKTVDSSTNSQVVTSDKDGLSQVTVNPYELDTKTVDSSTNSQTVVSDKDGLSEVVINPYTLDSKTVDSSTNSQVVVSSEDGLSSVTVNPYVLDSSSARLTENGNYSFTSDEDGLSRVDVEVDVNLNIQSKTVDPSTNSQVVSPDSGYNALSQVTVNAVDASIDPNITPQNIVIGKTILGVTGIADAVVYPSIVTKQIKRYDKIYCPKGVFFNTGVIPGTVGDHVTVEVEGTLDGDGGFTHGFSDTGTGDCYYRFFSLNSTVYFDLTVYSDRISHSPGDTVNTSHVYKFGCEDVNGTKQVLYIDGKLRASRTQSGTRTLNYPIGFFGFVKPDGTYSYSGGPSTNKYLKWAKIYRGNELLKEYYPVVDDEDNPCLYDVVNNEYVYPLGDATVSLGEETTPIEIQVKDWSTSNLQRKTVDSSTEQQIVTFDSSYVALYDVIVNPYTTEDKTVDPSTNDQTVTATGADALGTVTVKKYKVQSKSVDPSTNSQTVNPDSGYHGLSKVTVKPYVLDSSNAVITDNGNYSFLPTHNGLSRVDVSVNVDSLVPESIIVDPSTNQQVITPSQGYTGITQVTVNPYVLDQKSTTITQNGSYVLVSAEDGMSRVDISVNVEGGGSVVMQSKVVDPSSGQLSVTPDEGYTGLSEVTVNAVATESKTVDASTNQQIIEPGQDYAGLSQVTVNAVDASIDGNIVPGNIKKDVTILGVTGTVDAYAPDNDVIFVDFKGRILYSYSASEFANLTEMPSYNNFTYYNFLVGAGWNHTLEEAKTYVAENGGLVIGLVCDTIDGYPRIIAKTTIPNEKVFWMMTNSNGGYCVDWGDGSAIESYTDGYFDLTHTYSVPGTYIITFSNNGSLTFYFSTLSNINTRTSKNIYGLYFGNKTSSRANTDRSNNVIDFRYTYSLEEYSLYEYQHFDSESFKDCYNIKCLVLPHDYVTGLSVNYQVVCSGLLRADYVSINVFNANVTTYANSYGLKKICLKRNITSLPNNFLTSKMSPCKYYGLMQSSITTIGSGMFRSGRIYDVYYNPTNVTNTTMPSDMYRDFIGNVVIIPPLVTSLGAWSTYFANGSSVTDLYVYPTTPPTVNNYNLRDIQSYCRVWVPNGCLETYQVATAWSAYASQMIEMPA